MTISAGLLLYSMRDDGLHVLLGHMGGPLWARRDAGAWTIPKGEVMDGEDEHAAALREFAEEMGPPPLAEAPDLDLGTVRQRGGKVVHAWARPGEFDASAAVSNTFTMQWPPRSGRTVEFPELDRAAWFTLEKGCSVVINAQSELLERLAERLAQSPNDSSK